VIEVDQFIAAPPARVWQTLTDPEQHARLWAEGDGTRLLLEHSGFDLDDKRQRGAIDRMGPGWRDEVLPGLAKLLADQG
jgi:uncharacterized protein YndB with AHSA1/START domain